MQENNTVDPNIEGKFKLNDRVISKSMYSENWQGIVYKLYDYGVSVRFDNGRFEVFHYKPTHHMQGSIDLLMHAADPQPPLNALDWLNKNNYNLYDGEVINHEELHRAMEEYRASTPPPQSVITEENKWTDKDLEDAAFEGLAIQKVYGPNEDFVEVSNRVREYLQSLQNTTNGKCQK